ncbi:MAG: GIY-YIG nuclease family protein [Chitinophagaceae bacterium]|nr:GIY-YIG nuclease family protein [Chitinophagaceae bacterium]
MLSEKDKLLYIGYTSNLERRFMQHQNGESKSTAPRRPLKLIFAEQFLFKEDAMRREMYFKTTMGKKAIKLMLAGTLEKMRYKNPGYPKVEIIYDDSGDEN